MNFFARQPIFTAHGKLYGYELLYRDAQHLTEACITDQRQATSEVIVDGIAFASNHVPPHARIFINIPEELLHTPIAETIAPGHVVLEILETVPPTPANLAAIRHLRQLGYTLALDDYSAQPALRPFLDCVDVVKMDLQSTPPALQASVAAELRQRDRLMLAEKVETSQEAQQAIAAGYHLLQGFYFQRPELLHGKRMTPDALTRVRLENFLASPHTDKEHLQALFAHSPQLTFRLLNFVNSAALSPSKPVDSLQQALQLMGQERLHHWLAALLVADQSYPSDAMRELCLLGIFRAHFLYALAQSVHDVHADQLFALGLFSTLDAMYQTGFDELFRTAAINEDVKLALTARQGPFSPWLHSVILLENGEVDAARQSLAALGLHDFKAVVRLFRHSLEEAGHFLQHSKG